MSPIIANLLFPIPEALHTQYGSDNPDLFEGVLGQYFLALYCQPSDYKPVVTELGDVGQDGLVVGMSSTQVAIAARLEGFEVSTIEGRQAPVQILRALHTAAQATPGSYVPIVVYDGHRLWDGQALTNINGKNYVRRLMRLVSLTGASGSIASGLTTYSTGFTVRLMDVKTSR